MARLADGDRTAFDPVYEAVWPLFRGLAARMLDDPADADDAAQQALINVFSRASEFDSGRDALPWLLGIAAWECRTVRNKRARRREGPLDGIAPTVAATEAALVERDLLKALDALVLTLRPDDVATLRVALGRAERPDLPPATWRKRLERSLARLREQWRDRHGLP